MDRSDELLTVEEIASLLKVHPETIRGWLRERQMRGILLSRKSGWRVRASEVERFLVERENVVRHYTLAEPTSP